MTYFFECSAIFVTLAIILITNALQAVSFNEMNQKIIIE